MVGRRELCIGSWSWALWFGVPVLFDGGQRAREKSYELDRLVLIFDGRMCHWGNPTA